MRNTPFYTLTFHLISIYIYFDVTSGKRGPHHPSGDIDMKRVKMDEHIAPDTEHIKQDLQNMQLNESNIDKMTDEEKNFYYFKVHDSDNNDLLDGLELLQAAVHHVNVAKNLDTSEDREKELQHIIEVIDDFLVGADFDNDGYLDYPEYTKYSSSLSPGDEYNQNHGQSEDNHQHN